MLAEWVDVIVFIVVSTSWFCVAREILISSIFGIVMTVIQAGAFIERFASRTHFKGPSVGDGERETMVRASPVIVAG